MSSKAKFQSHSHLSEATRGRYQCPSGLGSFLSKKLSIRIRLSVSRHFSTLGATEIIPLASTLAAVALREAALSHSDH